MLVPFPETFAANVKKYSYAGRNTVVPCIVISHSVKNCCQNYANIKSTYQATSLLYVHVHHVRPHGDPHHVVRHVPHDAFPFL
jgi:hypothetical protein